jgi:flagellar basal body-associated protein FliL
MRPGGERMSDEQQDLSFEDVGEGGEAAGGPRKPGIFSGLVLTILKWAAAVVGIIILVVTVTVVTIGIRDRGRVAQNVAAQSPAYQPKEEPLSYTDVVGSIRGQTADEEPATFLVEISIGYAQNDKQVLTEIGQRAPQILDLCLKYLSRRTADELGPASYDLIQDDMRSQINGVMTSGKVKSVVFRQISVMKL